MQRAAPAGNRLTSLQLVAYGLPGLPLAVLLLPLFVILPTYYADDLGLGLATVGVVLLFARIWDVVTDPLIGLLSDRTRSRFGQRRPWLVAGAPLAFAGTVALFNPPSDVNGTYLLIATVVLYLGGTMILLPYTAWAAELSRDRHERSRIAAAREIAMVLGTLAAIAMPAALGLSRIDVVHGTSWALAVLIPLSVLIAVSALPDDPPARITEFRFRTSLATLWHNRPFRLLVSAYFTNGIAYGLPATLFLLYAQHILNDPNAAWMLLTIYFGACIAGLPAWLALSRKIGKRKSWIMAMAMAAAGFWPAILLGEGDVGWFIAICIVTGLPLGAELVMPPSIQADLAEKDAQANGIRRTGTMFGIWGVATKIPLALGVGIAFPVLDLAGFDAVSTDNNATALAVLAALYGLVPVLFKLFAIWIVRQIPD